ncbi:hypothetical protein Pint_27652 [Pistacia integerrima]|uniref:Uncharacterized protein n=1 Tax=Pistacia integerrima TaxID=434235 RepID=A0ACC0YU98_9ROSI|nr:hypothetical protein Pint_27652 [Pistacia integerrima]
MWHMERYFTVLRMERQNGGKGSHVGGVEENQAGRFMGSQHRSWVSVAGNRNQRLKMPMTYFKPSTDAAGVTTICPPISIAIEGRKQNESYMIQCLEDGPWLFQNRPILLQKWRPTMELSKEAPRVIPLWVKLFDVSLEFWNNVGLSYIESGVGKPLGMDRVMEDTCRLGSGCIGYARILVEVEATRKLPEVLNVYTPCEETGASASKKPQEGIVPRKAKLAKESKVKSTVSVSNVFQCLATALEERQDEPPDHPKNLGTSAVAEDKEMGCKIVIGWDLAFYRVEVQEKTDRVMRCLIRGLTTDSSFFRSVIYAANYHINKRELWRNLENFKEKVLNDPWLLMGDFNVTLNISESLGGVSYITTGMKEFKECVDNLEVEDINRAGILYTWNGKPHRDNGVMKKLDRVMGNSLFMTTFLRANTFFFPQGKSDHSLAMIVFPQFMSSKPRRFKFFNYLVYKEDFRSLVQQVWDTHIPGFPLFSVVQKPKALKPYFRALNRKQGNLTQTVAVLRKEVENIQSALDVDPHNRELREQEAVFSWAFREALLDEERLLR